MRKTNDERSEVIFLRLTKSEKLRIKAAAKRRGNGSVAPYVRRIVLDALNKEATS